MGALKRDDALVALGPQAAFAQLLLISVSFAALTHAYLTSDFSVSNVYENSHTLKPLIYKWSGVWGNHEGSMLLWVLILALFGAGVAAFSRNLPNDILGATLAVQAMIAAAFLAFVLFASNPFLRLAPAPFEGRDLNPILQDPGLAIHPPLLYLGYVGYSIVFSFAAGALIVGRIDAAFARMIRPWNLVAWITLTLGIAMGSYWAYYELGWGGYWFWDPVENASLMPWLTGTALLHSAIVMEKREALKIWTILLAIITFSLSLLGTFLVRSGVLTSVHAFAVDPERGLFILIILIAFIGGSFTLFCAACPRDGIRRTLRAGQPRGRIGPQQPVPRGGFARRAGRHALSARAGGSHGPENLGRPALLQPHGRAAHVAALRGDTFRAKARLETRRSPRRDPTDGLCDCPELPRDADRRLSDRPWPGACHCRDRPWPFHPARLTG